MGQSLWVVVTLCSQQRINNSVPLHPVSAATNINICLLEYALYSLTYAYNEQSSVLSFPRQHLFVQS